KGGDLDLHQVFCWRDWDVLRTGGRAGVVFPRGSLSGTGTAKWREDVLAQGAFEDVCFLTNTRQWVFDEVHPQYTVALATIRRGGKRVVAFNGPFHSEADDRTGRGERLEVPADEFKTWTSSSAFPLLPDSDSAGVFRQLRMSPRLDVHGGLDFRPVRELDM